MSQFLLQCITQDGIDLSHADQVRLLCEAGAKWIQLRMKGALTNDVKAVANEVLQICEDHGALLIINDHLPVAMDVAAGGVHLGRSDMDWKEARKIAGPEFIIGGTVNSLADAREALACRSLDYVGVGPLRYTKTKENLAPVLEAKALDEVVQFLGELPKVVIGGIKPDDLPAIASMDAEGVAVSSGLFEGGSVAENLKTYIESWPVQG